VHALAFAVAILFLISYVVYHYHAGSTHFPAPDHPPVYFFILTTHVILARRCPSGDRHDARAFKGRSIAISRSRTSRFRCG